MENTRKTKKFIFTSPLQRELKNAYYESKRSEVLKNELPSSFPIIIAMNAYVEEGDEIKIVPIITDDPDGFAKMNFESFKNELDQLAAAKKFSYSFEQESDGEKLDLHIYTPYDETISDHLALYSNLITRVCDDEIIYADTTFGTKPTSIIVQMALNCAYKLRKNTKIGAIVYGAITVRDTEPQKGFIHDVSPLFFMDAISNRMAQIKVENPVERIKNILAINIDDDESEE